MKTVLKMMLFIGCFTFGTAAFAQTSGVVISKGGAIVLDNTQPLKSSYAIPAARFNFTTQEEAIAYFAQKQSAEVAYRPVVQNGEVMVYLQINSRPNWTVADWNTYFLQHKVINAEVTNQTSK